MFAPTLPDGFDVSRLDGMLVGVQDEQGRCRGLGVLEHTDGTVRVATQHGDEMRGLLRAAGLEPSVTTWGWPMVRLYDDLFLTRVNRRRLQHQGTVEQDATLSAVSSMGKKRLLVSLVKTVFGIDRVFDGTPWGVGLLFSGRKTEA